MPRRFSDSSNSNKEPDVILLEEQVEQLRGELQLKNAEIARLIAEVRGYKTETGDRDELIDTLTTVEKGLKDAQKINTKLAKQLESEKQNRQEQEETVEQLRTASEDLYTTIRSLRKEISDLKTAPEQLDDTADTSVGKQDKHLKQEIDDLKAEITAISQRDQALLREKNNQEQQTLALRKELATLSRELTDTQDSLVSAERRLREQQAEIDALSSPQGETLDGLQSSDVTESQLVQEQLLNAELREQLQTAMQEKQNAIQTMRNDLSVADSTLVSLREEQTQLSLRAEEIERNNASLTNQVATLNTTISEQTTELETTHIENTALRAELQNVRDSLARSEQHSLELQQNLDALDVSHQEVVTDLRGQLDILGNMLLNEQGLNAELGQKLQRTTQERDSALATVDQLQTTLASSTDRLESLQQAHDELERHSRQLDDTNSSLSNEITDLKAELKEAKKRETDLSKELNSTRKRLTTTESKLERLQGERATLVSSHEVETKAFQQESDQLRLNLAQEQELNGALQEQLQTALQEMATLRTANATLEDNAKRSETQIAELLARIQQFEENLSSSDESGYQASTSDEELSEQADTLESGDEEAVVVEEAQLPPVVANPRPQTPALDVAAQVPAARRPEPANNPSSLKIFWNLFLQHGGIMEHYFTDELVKKGNQTTFQIPPHVGALTSELVGGTEPLYESVSLSEGDFIHSTAAFAKEGSTSDEVVIGHLIQDHHGKVTNITKDALSPAQQCVMALRQAEMMLNNFKPKVDGDDAIIISGKGEIALEAKRLIAALLVLKDQPEYSSKLKNVQIISKVPGCDIPQPSAGTFSFITGKKSQETVNKKFIAEFLPPSLVNQDWQQRIKQQVGKFEHVKEENKTRVKEMKQALHDGREAEGGPPLSEERKGELAQSIEDETIKPGDKIDLEGTITHRR